MVDPPPSHADPKQLFPDSTAPRLIATQVHNTSVPADPFGNVFAGDVPIGTPTGNVTIHIQANNVPPGTPVQVRIVPANANASAFTVISTPLKGSFVLSTATATATFPSGPSTVTLRAVLP
jgi:hypothetical protein